MPFSPPSPFPWYSRSPRSVAEERESDIDVGAERRAHGWPVLLGAHQRLPRIEVLRFVKVAVGDVRKVLEAGYREQIVAIAGFPYIDEIGQLIAMIPQVAGADLDPSRRAMVRMTGDAERALSSNLAQDVVGPLIG